MLVFKTIEGGSTPPTLEYFTINNRFMSTVFLKNFNKINKVVSLSVLVGMFSSESIWPYVFLVTLLSYIFAFNDKYNYNSLFKLIIISTNLSLLFLLKNLFYVFFENSYELYCVYLDTNLFGLCGWSPLIFFDFLSINISFLTNLLLVILLNYSYFYMKKDMHLVKFIQMIMFFGLSMLFFLSSGDLLGLFFGWELVGLSSFFLINFWGHKCSVVKSALKAFTFNKFSDTLFFMFVVIFVSNNSINMSNIFNGSGFFTYNPYIYIGFCFLCFCGFFKSVQIGFHVWLPDSMEAPMPASALIHSATLISAGLYLTLRFSIYINMYFNDLYIISVFTAFYGSLSAFMQTDLKKILAYSTISHCGYMYIPVFFDEHFVFIVYFYIHGFTKALCFLLVGLVIQDVSHYQDFRKTPFLFSKESFEFYLLLPTLFSLGGLPFFLGFFSKTLVLGMFSCGFYLNLCYILLDLSSLSALFYCINLYKNIFFLKKDTYVKTNSFNYQNFNLIYLVYVFWSLLGLFLLPYYLFFNGAFTNLVGTKLLFVSNTWSFYIYKLLPFVLYFKLSSDFYKNLTLLFFLFVLF